MAEYVPGRKVPIPRKLDTQETAASLRLWKVAFTNYYRADVYFGLFVQAEATWKVGEAEWGFADEGNASHLKRRNTRLSISFPERATEFAVHATAKCMSPSEAQSFS